MYEIDGESHTGAYLASRLACQTLTDFFSEYSELPGGDAAASELACKLRGALATAFNRRLTDLDAVESPLKGSLIRRLPTTMAAVLFDVAPSPPELVRYTVLWAGDTRAYVLDPALGVQQLSIDDIKTDGDALENLVADSPLSNCVCACSSFVVNANNGLQPLPAVFLVATDGCFNYFLSPAHFEFALLDTLVSSQDDEDWSRRLRERIAKRPAMISLSP